MKSKIDELNKLNQGITIKSIESYEFRKFGRKVEGLAFEQFDSYMEELSMPIEEVVYYPSIDELENNKIFSIVSNSFYGGQPIQIGYCAGDNTKLEGLEYHKGNEILYAVTDMVLLLGHIWDIEGNSYSSDKVEVFFVTKGCAIEIFATTLHFAPCKVEKDGFKSVIILPKGTNNDLDFSAIDKYREEDELLFMNNKWLLAHSEAKDLINSGAFEGITGENIKINY